MAQDHCLDFSNIEKQGAVGVSSIQHFPQNRDQTVVTVVTSNGELDDQFLAVAADCFEAPGADVNSVNKFSLPRNESFHEQCRVCQQQAEEALIDLGCQCRGGLAKAHRSCIDTWFLTKGSNKCEICQQVAVNILPPPDSQPSRNYWGWRVVPSYRGHLTAAESERGCHSALWVVFSVLIGGLLLDVLISISLGISAVHVNVVIGFLVLLGLGTALRLALEWFHELSLRGAVHQNIDRNANIGPLGKQEEDEENVGNTPKHRGSQLGGVSLITIMRKDCTGKWVVHPKIKVTVALHYLSYGVSADALDEIFALGEQTSRDSLFAFCDVVMHSFGLEYLRIPNRTEIQRILADNEARGWPGYLGSLDCTHWKWERCPTTVVAIYVRHEKRPSIVLEVATTQDSWIWHSYFGEAGNHNDINVLEYSPLFHEYCSGLSASTVLHSRQLRIFYWILFS